MCSFIPACLLIQFSSLISILNRHIIIFSLGCNGLEELLGIEPAFAEFQDTLFNQGSVMLERSVQTKEINEKLDQGISLFLARISPYFLLKPAQKCLEWLIHRYGLNLILHLDLKFNGMLSAKGR